MRICRFIENDVVVTGIYSEELVVSIHDAAKSAGIDIPESAEPLDHLPHGALATEAERVWAWAESWPDELASLGKPRAETTLLTPIAQPPKILLLAGNYAAHIEEEGKVASEREETFPYVFMKPTTTLNHPDAPIPIPEVSPKHIDYECELGIVMGREAKCVDEANALEYVAGYTVMNDISDRQYRPNPNRRQRERDMFFDWQHGKWHDGFCPVGPAVTSSATIPDPQTLALQLCVNNEMRQSSTTGFMIFPVAALISFISQSVTLQPGDLIATGTPAGVGAAMKKFLKPGDVIEAYIEGIGTLVNTLE